MTCLHLQKDAVSKLHKEQMLCIILTMDYLCNQQLFLFMSFSSTSLGWARLLWKVFNYANRKIL